MTKVDDGGPAFPGEKETRFGQHNDCNEGMSLRDYFAGQALAGMLALPSDGNGSFHDNCGEPFIGPAKYAYAMADAMLRARREGSEQS